MTLSVRPDQPVTPSADEIRGWSYVRLLAEMRESNLPPGGFHTVLRLAQDLCLGPHVKVLHSGCNSGFLSRELARRTGCTITGIDISPEMAAAANARAKAEGLAHLAAYENRDMRATGWPDQEFDAIISGGALAFVEGKDRAVAEWLRLIKPHGLIGNAELWYHQKPSQSLLDDVAEIIGVPVPLYTREYWDQLFSDRRLQPWTRHEAEAGARTDVEVEAYCSAMVSFVSSGWDNDAREALYDRWLATFKVFNENMKHLSYTMFTYCVLPVAHEPVLYV